MRGIVASGHPRVTEAAGEVLRAGGNAFDAAVAAGFASAVAEPALTSLGGGGFLLARPAEGRSVLFDFFVDTPGRGRDAAGLEPHFLPVTVHFPGSDQIFNVGLGSVAVPGNLRGLLRVHARLGRLPLAEVVGPAAQLARHGLCLEPRQAYFLKLLEPIMTLTEAGRALFAPGGRYVAESERFTNPELAAWLDALPRDGDREFYEGEVARRICRDMDTQGGLLTRDDLASYRVVERDPLVVRYRGAQLLTNPPPSFGGSLLALSLHLFEAGDPRTMCFAGREHLALLTGVMLEVDRCRAEGRLAPEDHSEASLATSRRRARCFTRGTTHVSVWDAAGNAASMTTSNGEGSGYLAPGTGIMLNNMMGEDDLHPDGFHAGPAGERVASMMSPSVLLDRAGVRLVLGSGGSKRIRTALLQVLCNVIDWDLPVREAVEAPRVHWDGSCLQVEPGFDSAVLDALRRACPLNTWSVRDVYFGGVHAVAPREGGGAAAGDPRRGGVALRFE